jgi:uncharacterized membrane protein YczE
MGPLRRKWLWTVKAISAIIITEMRFFDRRQPRTRPVAPGSVAGAPWPLWARLVQLVLGLWLYGGSLALMVRSGLGLDSWDVFHQGLARHTHIAIGTWTILVGLVVLLLWIPLRMRPGVGTICNVVLIGVSLNAALEVVPTPHSLAVRSLFMVGGIVLCGVATGAYIGAALGPGPRDGLMVGLAKRGHSIRVVRTLLEVTVLLGGFLLGGTVGIGTLLFTVSIGPLAHVTIPAFTRRPTVRTVPGQPEVEVPCASA